MIDWDLNLFHSDPTLLQRSDEDAYERAAQLAETLSDPRRLKLLHALSVGEATPQRAAVWSGLDQPFVERELAAMTLAGLVERHDDGAGPVYAPRDGHLVVELHVALAHGRELIGERHPRLLKPRRSGHARERKVG
jgi:ArsR family transcriptional regulator, zinc-responsive transcriptional repressor